MQMRIGGDFELSEDILVAEPICDFNTMTRNVEHYIWTDIGRSAIFLALLDIEQLTNKRVVHLPTFVCDAVKQPFLQRNYEINYYSLGETLCSPENLPIVKEDEIFFFVHYFGHQNRTVVEWLANQNRTFFIIEDCVQSSLSEFENNISDYKIYSFRKFTPQIDGALLISKRPLNINLEKPNKAFLKQQLQGKLIRSWTDKSEYFIDLLKGSEETLNNQVVPKSISSISKYIMERVDFSAIKSRRRANWQYFNEMLLAEELLHNRIIPLNNQLSEGEVPLGYAMRVATNRDELRLFLMEHNIFCPIHWQISFSLNKADRRLSETILTIPLDQRLGKKEIEYIINCLKSYYGG